jgi:hypothetical protein
MIYRLVQMNISSTANESFEKNYLDANYLPRKISNIHYDNRQKTIFFFHFFTPNLEFIYFYHFHFIIILIIKMESYKEEKIVSWSGKMHFLNHLP